jgi:TRAP-type C4-dicarboxylate transport system substrate-binding protein
MRFTVLALVALATRTAHADPGWEPVRLRLGTLAIDDSRYVKDILALAKEIEKRTRGSVQIDWVTGGQLGDDKGMADLVTRGKLDGGGFTEAGLIALVPDMAAWQYPGMFRDYAGVDRATAAVDDAVRKRFVERDLRFLMWADLGFANLFSVDPIPSLRDLLVKAAPSLTLPLDGKLTEAIATGQIRVWALPPLFTLAIANAKPRHMTGLRYRYIVGGLVLSKAAWAKLDVRQQKALLDVCREWQPKIRASWRKETENGIAALTKSGVATRASSEAEVTAFVDASVKSRENHVKPAGVAELVAMIANALLLPR